MSKQIRKVKNLSKNRISKIIFVGLIILVIVLGVFGRTYQIPVLTITPEEIVFETNSNVTVKKSNSNCYLGSVFETNVFGISVNVGGVNSFRLELNDSYSKGNIQFGYSHSGSKGILLRIGSTEKGVRMEELYFMYVAGIVLYSSGDSLRGDNSAIRYDSFNEFDITFEDKKINVTLNGRTFQTSFWGKNDLVENSVIDFIDIELVQSAQPIDKFYFTEIKTNFKI